MLLQHQPQWFLAWHYIAQVRKANIKTWQIVSLERTGCVRERLGAKIRPCLLRRRCLADVDAIVQTRN